MITLALALAGTTRKPASRARARGAQEGVEKANIGGEGQKGRSKEQRRAEGVNRMNE